MAWCILFVCNNASLTLFPLFLKSAKYKHLGGKVIEEKMQGDKAVVVLQAEIDTVAGSAKQKEFYLIKRINGKCLIDDIIVKEEELEELKEEL